MADSAKYEDCPLTDYYAELKNAAPFCVRRSYKYAHDTCEFYTSHKSQHTPHARSEWVYLALYHSATFARNRFRAWAGSIQSRPYGNRRWTMPVASSSIVHRPSSVTPSAGL